MSKTAIIITIGIVIIVAYAIWMAYELENATDESELDGHDTMDK